MKHFFRLFMCILFLGIASTSQATTITAPVETNPSSEDNLWAYSFSDSGLSSSAYHTELPLGTTFLGYVAATHGPWADSFEGLNSDFSDNTSIHVFETYLMSSITQTVRISLGGDDGHSTFVDDEFQSGATIGNHNYADLTMTADTQYKVSFVLNNNTGGWHANFGLSLLQADGTSYSPVLFSDAPNILMNATGDFTAAPVPEPATMMLFGIGLLGLAGVSRRRK